jgi:hypothetical protein
MLVAGAWYTVYQYQEQARQSAQEYGQAIAKAKPVSGWWCSNNSNEIDKTASMMSKPKRSRV